MVRSVLLFTFSLSYLWVSAQQSTRSSSKESKYDLAFNFFDFLGYNANLQGTYYLSERWGLVGYAAHGLRSTGVDNFPSHENYRIEFGGRFLIDPDQFLFLHLTYQRVFTKAWFEGEEWVEVFRDGLYYYELQTTNQRESFSQGGVTLYMGKRWSRDRVFLEFLMGVGYRQSNMSDREEIFALDDIVHSGHTGPTVRLQFLLGIKLN